jgi:transcription-repair coupling factor (superfamily II helicase)
MAVLASLLASAQQLPSLRRTLRALAYARRVELVGLQSEAVAWWVAALANQTGALLIVCPTPDRALELQADLATFTTSVLYPAWDILPFDPMDPDPAITRGRLQLLVNLLTYPPRGAIVTSVKALMDPSPQPEQLSSHVVQIGQGSSVAPRLLMEKLFKAGYRLAHQVDGPGTMAIRGGIVDVFPPNLPMPVRLEFLGDEVEEVRSFDPYTQRSVERVQQVALAPASEAPFAAELLVSLAEGLDLSTCRREVAEEWSASIEKMFQDGTPGTSLRFALTGHFGTLLDYLPPHVPLFVDRAQQCYMVAQDLHRKAQERQEALLRDGELPRGLHLPLLTTGKLFQLMGSRPAATAGGWEVWEPQASVRIEPGEVQPAPFLRQSWHDLVDEVRMATASGATVVVTSQHSTRIAEILDEHDLSPVLVKGQELPALAPGHTYATSASLSAGWSSPLAALLVLTDRELFGERARPRELTSRPSRGREPWIEELSPGDYVVHVDHGVARYGGLTVMATDGVSREYLVLEYAEGDRLYVPTDQSHRVSRYLGPDGAAPTLTRLGSGEWSRATQKVRRAVQDLAQELTRLYAARQLAEGFSYGPDMPWEKELAESFPYVETPDQQQAIEEVLADMQRPFPMDRLVCGDVGYGKTEVAVRAAFKAVTYGKQVAVLVPTTVLAQQHYQTFRDRLAPFPVRIEVLSRFRSPREQKKVLEELAKGSVDIVIGTHRLLQPDVRFRDLGLLIVDEEQRFGVRHKERLKWLRLEVDVLTLAATPIPRTLYMSLVGVRDMSLIATPPPGRQAIKTYVLRHDDETVRSAVLRELQRGGQVFYVHNRVQTIHHAADKIAKLVPEARIAIAHGQLPEDQLDRIMVDFVAGRYDVLVCTTIIEAGLDMPRVNTIIIEDADRFGLAQLYQLRGRVGRGNQRAYAYLLYDPARGPAGRGIERLQAILEATELGSGFRLAMMDLEIRGAGNLLGPEQHGHLAAVGFSLYSQMLADAVAELKGQQPKISEPTVAINLPLPAYLPEDYVDSDLLRVNLYRRLAGIRTLQELADFRSELEDRFGPIPPPAEDLLFLMRLKLLAAEAGIRSITRANGHLVVKVDRLKAYPRGLPGRLTFFDGEVHYRPAHPHDWKPELARLVEGLRE